MKAECFARSGGFMLAKRRVLCQIGGLYASKEQSTLRDREGLSDRGPFC